MCTLSAQTWHLPAQIPLDYTAISSKTRSLHQGEIIAPCPKKLLLAVPRPLPSRQRAFVFDLEKPQCVDCTALPLQLSDSKAPHLPFELDVSIETVNIDETQTTSSGKDDETERDDPRLDDSDDDTEAFTEFIEIVHTATTQLSSRARSLSPVDVDRIPSVLAISPTTSPNAGSSGSSPSALALNSEPEFDALNLTLGLSPVYRSVNPMPRDRSFALKKELVTYQRSRRGSLESPMPKHPMGLSASKLRQLRLNDYPEPFLCLSTFSNCTVSRSRSLSGENAFFNQQRWNIWHDQVRPTLS